MEIQTSKSTAMPQLDLNTLEWVLKQSSELNNRIWDLREEIQNQIQIIKEDGPKKKISLFRQRSHGNGIPKDGFKVSLNKAVSSRS